MIDIIICTRNRPNLLKKAIHSVLKQNDIKYSLFILDNCSEPVTEKICKSLLPEKSNYIRHSRNLGMVGNWNHAIGVGDSEYFMILHDDDELEPNFTFHANNYLQENGELSFIHSAASIINQNGDVIGLHNSKCDKVISGYEYFKKWSVRGILPMCPSVIYNRNLMLKCGGFSDLFPYTADIMCYISLARYGSVGYIDKPILKYRKHEDSTTSGFLNNMDLKVNDRLASEEYINNIAKSFFKENCERNFGKEYVNFALTSDLLFIKLVGGSFKQVLRYLVKIFKARPRTFMQTRMAWVLILSLFPVKFLRFINRKKNKFFEIFKIPSN